MPSLFFDPAHKDLVHDIKYDFHGLLLATASSDHRIKIWERRARCQWLLADSWRAHDASVMRVSFAHPHYGRLLASCSLDRSVRIWEELPGAGPSTLSSSASSSSSSSSSSTNPNYMPPNSGNASRATAAHWLERARLTDARCPVTDVAFAPPPRCQVLRLATAAVDGSLRVYAALDPSDMSQWALVGEVPACATTRVLPTWDPGVGACLAWSPCANFLLAAGPRHATVFVPANVLSQSASAAAGAAISAEVCRNLENVAIGRTSGNTATAGNSSGGSSKNSSSNVSSGSSGSSSSSSSGGSSSSSSSTSSSSTNTKNSNSNSHANTSSSNSIDNSTAASINDPGYLGARSKRTKNTQAATAAAAAAAAAAATAAAPRLRNAHSGHGILQSSSGEGMNSMGSASTRNSLAWEPICVLESQSSNAPVTCVSWAANFGRSYHLIATGSRDCVVRIYRIHCGDDIYAGFLAPETVAVLSSHTNQIWRVEWSIAGSLLASTADDSTMRIWKPNGPRATDWQCVRSVSVASRPVSA